jgi:hypothetical protein
VHVTAPTGIAATLVDGTTLHKFTGCGLCKEAAETLAGRVFRSEKTLERWQSCKVLVVDEVSMLSGEFFSKLEHIARLVRRNDAPFGGIQLVLCGDFFQVQHASAASNGVITGVLRSIIAPKGEPLARQPASRNGRQDSLLGSITRLSFSLFDTPHATAILCSQPGPRSPPRSLAPMERQHMKRVPANALTCPLTGPLRCHVGVSSCHR